MRTLSGETVRPRSICFLIKEYVAVFLSREKYEVSVIGTDAVVGMKTVFEAGTAGACAESGAQRPCGKYC